MAMSPAAPLTADLLFGAYHRRHGDALHLVATGQWLNPLRANGQEQHFQYADPETDLAIVVILKETPPGALLSIGCEAQIDFRDARYAPLHKSYGLWRRVAWFLLDAVQVWLHATDKAQRKLTIRGGWVGGAWSDNVRLEISSRRDGGSRDRLATPLDPYGLYPLDAPAPIWRYFEGLAGAREGWIATHRDAAGALVADLSVPAERQLGDAPRFVADDGTILFFNRVVSHVGPDYAPARHYGLLSWTHVHYFGDRHGTLCGEPVPLAGQAASGVLAERTSEPLKKLTGQETRPRLHPSLREAQFFAGLEAYGLIFGRPLTSMPLMAALDSGQTCHFGYGLAQISDPPIAVGLPFTSIEAWPRLATDEPAMPGEQRWLPADYGSSLYASSVPPEVDEENNPALYWGLGLFVLAIFAAIVIHAGGIPINDPPEPRRLRFIWLLPLGLGLIAFGGFVWWLDRSRRSS
jgi:hypothetical protein